MDIHDQKQRLSVKNSDISGSLFDDVNASGATLHNMNMSGWHVDYVNLAGLRLTKANLAGASISDSRYDGMTIDGISEGVLPVTFTVTGGASVMAVLRCRAS